MVIIMGHILLFQQGVKDLPLRSEGHPDMSVNDRNSKVKKLYDQKDHMTLSLANGPFCQARAFGFLTESDLSLFQK